MLPFTLSKILKNLPKITTNPTKQPTKKTPKPHSKQTKTEIPTQVQVSLFNLFVPTATITQKHLKFLSSLQFIWFSIDFLSLALQIDKYKPQHLKYEDYVI